jgi:predicted nucleic acid-binding protein
VSIEFCDTNILVYASQRGADRRTPIARTLVTALGDRGEGALSIQVLQELYTALTKMGVAGAPARARDVVAALAESWRVFVPQPDDVLAAIDSSQRWQISLWDAMIITAARRSGATTVWSEGLSHGQRYDDVTVRNPFA